MSETSSTIDRVITASPGDPVPLVDTPAWAPMKSGFASHVRVLDEDGCTYQINEVLFEDGSTIILVIEPDFDVYTHNRVAFGPSLRQIAEFKRAWHEAKPGERVESGLAAAYAVLLSPEVDDEVETPASTGEQTLFEACGVPEETGCPVCQDLANAICNVCGRTRGEAI